MDPNAHRLFGEKSLERFIDDALQIGGREAQFTREHVGRNIGEQRFERRADGFFERRFEQPQFGKKFIARTLNRIVCASGISRR